MEIEPILFSETPEEDSKYLTIAQIELVHQRLMESETSLKSLDILDLIDSFVRANEKADEAYEKLYLVVKTSLEANAGGIDYPSHIMVTFPIVTMIAFYDYLILTGIMSEIDIDKMQSEIMRMSMNGGPAKA